MATAMTISTLPFGRHRGVALPNVPTPYLNWALRTVKMSGGLRAAVRAELSSRPDCPKDLPDEPAPKSPQCRRCGGAELRLHWQQLGGAGGRVIRGDCRRCGQFVLFVVQTAEHIAQADAEDTDPTPAPPGGEEFELRLVALPDSVSAAVRLRRLLKSALRGQRLKCTSVRDVTAPPPGDLGGSA